MKSKFNIKNNFLLATVIALVISFLVFYIYLPPINLYSIDFYMFLTVVVIIFCCPIMYFTQEIRRMLLNFQNLELEY